MTVLTSVSLNQYKSKCKVSSSTPRMDLTVFYKVGGCNPKLLTVTIKIMFLLQICNSEYSTTQVQNNKYSITTNTTDQERLSCQQAILRT